MTSPQPHHPSARQGAQDRELGQDSDPGQDREPGQETEFTAEQGDPTATGLGEPRRVAVAGAELLVVLALVLVTWWAWGRGTVLVDMPAVTGEQGAVQQVTRSLGNWQAAAIGAATAAGLVLLDLCRQLWLGPRPGRRTRAGTGRPG
ncbi:hypothetical protein IQ251_10575 [Saccharopolyspora sp. HNM0983]|uniref:Uncharacterized protein n=1 Tax=Saccharopolyspora montiporae TaxID=2781240 RepID=A0A929G0J5_9PSEU|nr:hypothetical protein [Saccharopolyspora sp. HNM0983]MBE9374887.1 hypothetical protein [Saccharopolyspora sp. HNM0983]